MPTRSSTSLQRLESHIGELVDTAALNPDLWSTVVAEIQQAYRGVRVQMQAHDPSFGRPLILVSAGWSERHTRNYHARLAHLNEVGKAFATSAPFLTPVKLPDYVLPVDRFLRSEFYNEGLRLEGEAECGTGLRIFQDGQRHATLAVQYGVRGSDTFHSQVALLLRRIAPRLKGAILANRSALRGTIGSAGSDLVQVLIDAAFIVYDDRRIVATNEAAKAFTANSDLVSIGPQDRLSISQPEIDAKFSSLLKLACQATHGSAGYLEFGFIHDTTQWRMSILPIAQNRPVAGLGIAPLFVPRNAALIIFRREDLRDGASVFQSRYRLSNAELRIVRALCGGGSLVTIAGQLGISYETARIQLKAAFSKTGTHSQRELLRMFLAIET